MKNHPYMMPSFIDSQKIEHHSPSATCESISKMLGEPKQMKSIPSVKVVNQHQAVIISNQKPEQVFGKWQLTLENGKLINGLSEDNTIDLGDKLPLGYHQLTTETAEGKLSCRVIVTPEKAFLPKEIKENKKLWGATLQLYTLRSEKNWGIGDFSDLKNFLEKMAERGSAFVGLNPIHALFPTAPEEASPYSPSSRLWLNVIYIDLNAVEAFQQSSSAQTWFDSDTVQEQLTAERNADHVNYTGVIALKIKGLKLAYQQFKQAESAEFEQFILESGESLQVQATFETLQDYWVQQGTAEHDWRKWDIDYQNYHSETVKAFKVKHIDTVRFYCWLQYLANQQLHACNELTQSLGMPIGFYRDLAVGVATFSAETWANKELYLLDASIGAPPDSLAPQGQDWNLSAMHPEILQSLAYQPFIDLLQANMKDCGALRIDHILAFARLWLTPKGESSKDGVYVRYPLEDLLAIVALESQRNTCLVIAEALGVVPDKMLETLEEKNILTYNIFYFEMNDSGCKPLVDYPTLAMTAVSTHDLPTIEGFWQHDDINLANELGICTDEAVLDRLREERDDTKERIFSAMTESGAVKFTEKPVSHQLQIHAAASNSVLFAIQPEDWMNILKPVNIPGTDKDYPNWRRKLTQPINEIFSSPEINDLMQKIATKRNQ